MTITKYEELRRKNIKMNVAKLESIGIRNDKQLLNQLCMIKKNDYRVVPSRKISSEDSGSDYDPLDDGTTESEESDSSSREQEETPSMVNLSSRTKALKVSEMAPGARNPNATRKSPRFATEPSANSLLPEERSGSTIQEHLPLTNRHIPQQRSPGTVEELVPSTNTQLPEERSDARVQGSESIPTSEPINEGASSMHVADQASDTVGQFELQMLGGGTPSNLRDHRKPTWGKGLNKLTRSMGHKLPLSFVEGKKRPVQPLQAAKLASESGIVVCDHMPIFTHWKDYKSDAKDHLKDHMGYLANRFAMDVADPAAKRVCSDLLKSGVRQQRYRMKRKYFNGVPENEVLSRKPPRVSQQEWENLVQKWKDPKHQETSEKNKHNRQKVRLHQTTGSRCYVAQRFSLEDQYNGLETDPIDLFKASHYSKKKGYSDAAQEAIDAMESLRDQPVAEGEQPKAADEIVEGVLSEFSKTNRFLVNMGIRSGGTTQASNASSSARIRELEEVVEVQRLREEKLCETVGSQQEEIIGLKKQVEEATESSKKHEEQMAALISKQQRTDELLLRVLSGMPNISSGLSPSQ
ncbi:hypothetical protein ACP4OV_027253 [Aristida adscensionis]